MSNGYTFVLNGLRAKRAEISGEVLAVEKRLAELRADLENLDRTILLFDPDAKPATIKPRLKRKSENRFRQGEMTRTILGILRNAGTELTVRDVALLVAKEHGPDVSTPAAMNALIANVRNALSRPRDGVVCRKREDGVKVWAIQKDAIVQPSF